MAPIFTCDCGCKCGECEDSDCDCECHDIPGTKEHLNMFCVMEKMTSKKNLTKNQCFKLMSESDDPDKTINQATKFIRLMLKHAPKEKPSRAGITKNSGYKKLKRNTCECEDDV